MQASSLASRDAMAAGFDGSLRQASEVVTRAGPGRTSVEAFFDQASHTFSYVVHDAVTRRAAIVDPVLGAPGPRSTSGADEICSHVHRLGLGVDWMLETHVHADHRSAARYLKRRLGGAVAIGSGIDDVARDLRPLIGGGELRPSSGFDRLFDDGDAFEVGDLQGLVLHSPGHTPIDVAYVVGDAVFVGDTMFMPDGGTARADFPGGSARALFRSIRRLLRLPPAARIFVCHDYGGPDRSTDRCETTVQAQRVGNIHASDRVAEDDFVRMREARDATLAPPAAMLDSLGANLRGGLMPERLFGRPRSNRSA